MSESSPSPGWNPGSGAPLSRAALPPAGSAPPTASPRLDDRRTRTRPPGRLAGTRASRLLVVLGILGGWLLAFAPAASAHAQLGATTPGNGEHLVAAPTQASMKFSERVTLIRNGIQVLDRSGQRRNKAEPHVNGDTVVIPLDRGLTDGVYTVNWRVVSADSHPINGAFVFSVGSASASALTGPAENSGAASAVTDSFWLFRWGGYAGLALLVGGVFFRVVCWPAGRRDRRARRIVWAGWITSIAAAVGSLLLQGPNSDGSSIMNAFDPALLGATLSTDFGISVIVRVVLLAGIVPMLRWLFAADGATEEATSSTGRLSRARLGALAAAGIALVATWSWTGHAHVGDQAPLAVVADVAHLSAMSVWVGGLVLLTGCVLPRQRAVLSEAARALPRFSVTAMVAVGVLVTTGVYAAWREVRSLSALAGTEYGKLLIFKLAAFGVLMALAAMSRTTVQRRYVMPVVRAAAAQAPPRPRSGGSSKPGGGSKSGKSKSGPKSAPKSGGKSGNRSGGKSGGGSGGKSGGGSGAQPGSADAAPAKAGAPSSATSRTGTSKVGASKAGASKAGTSKAAQRSGAALAVESPADAAPAVSRKVLRQQEEQERTALGALRQSVRLEVGVVVGVLGLTAVLVATPPGQVAGAFQAAPAAAATTPQPFSKVLTLSDKTAGSVHVFLQPAHTGDNTVVIDTLKNNTAHDVSEVTAELTLPAQKLGPLPVKLTRIGVGQYNGKATVPVPGTWHLKVLVRVSEFDEATASADIPVN